MGEEGREPEKIKYATEELRQNFAKLLDEVHTQDWRDDHVNRWNDLLRAARQLNDEYKEKAFDPDYYDRLSKLMEQLEVLVILGDSGAVDIRKQRAKMEKASRRPPKSRG